MFSKQVLISISFPSTIISPAPAVHLSVFPFLPPQTGNGHALPPGCFLPPMPAATSACGGYAPASSNHGTSASSKSSLLLQWRQHAAVLLGASRAGAPEAARCSQALSRLGEQLKRLPGQVGAGRIDLLSGHIDVLSLSAHSHGQSAANSVC